jgi:hypothetical protein
MAKDKRTSLLILSIIDEEKKSFAPEEGVVINGALPQVLAALVVTQPRKKHLKLNLINPSLEYFVTIALITLD